MVRYALLILATLWFSAWGAAAAQPASGRSAVGGWPEGFEAVDIPDAMGEAVQPAMLRRAEEMGQPLIVVLHTWSGDWKQRSNSLAEEATVKDWDYIHPDFGGANDHPGACCSGQAVAGIDAAIAYGLEQTSADPARVHVVGTSGGGYAALCHLMRGRESATSYDAWASITDLVAWHGESVQRGSKYHRDILACTASKGGILDTTEAYHRSPLHLAVPNDKFGSTRVRLYTGIRDGYDDSVPITHSLHFYNKIAAATGASDSALVPCRDMVHMLAAIDGPGRTRGAIGGREVLYRRSRGPVSLVVFQGEHETLESVALDRAEDSH